MKINKNALDRCTKPELIDRVFKSILSHQESKKESDQIISKLEEKIRNLNREAKLLRAKSIENLTDVEMMKEVLALKATGKSSSRIYEILNENRGISIDASEVRSICDSVDNLSEEMKAHYNKQKKLYFDNLSFNKEDILQGDILTIEGMIDTSKRALEIMDANLEEDDFNFDDYRKLQDHISKLIKDKSAIMKSISGKGDEGDDEDFEIGYAEEESEEFDMEGFSVDGGDE